MSWLKKFLPIGDDHRRQGASFGFQVLKNTNKFIAIEPWFDFICGINGRLVVRPPSTTIVLYVPPHQLIDPRKTGIRICSPRRSRTAPDAMWPSWCGARRFVGVSSRASPTIAEQRRASGCAT